MYCTLWVIVQILAVVVEAGGSSGSNEALANNNGAAAAAAAGNGANAGAQNGVPLMGEPIVARLVQLGGSLFIQPLGNPVDQALLQQLIPVPVLPQGVNVVLGQAVGANGNLQGQLAQQAIGGPLTLFAVLPQNNGAIDPRLAMLTPGQMQLLSMVGPNNQQPRGKVRHQRSVAARLRRTKSLLMKAAAAEEKEESSGMESKETELMVPTYVS